MSLFKRKSTPRVPELIIEADEPALFYSSISRAEQDLEAIDVSNGVYKTAFGPQGQLYRVESDGDLVVIYLDEDHRSDPDRLKQLLLRFLDAVNVPATESESIEELLAKCRPYTE